ncbi:hypothetical protein [Ruminiclostridium cellobioparum]|uniref:Uncharacterized protein n=1 Tax=Ruminiclostridium cellobioparum subsp. termitidis CT1112 TaxID=1195236 RepID=S0FRV8_RUMCE|nr:hypothetical protein [Ruminiclostridium cellobioparum]EMS71228.1 hypothetical protein CTER_2879 [Ruminiclostridium cellobioparum subsp. termitidis CT1112]
MQKLVRTVLYLFTGITIATALLTLIGIGYVWFVSDIKDLPYLKWLIGVTVVEIASVVLLIGKKGLRYLPETRTDKKKEDTIDFMEKFISTGTNATIISNRASWLISNDKLIKVLKSKIDSGLKIEIITTTEISQQCKEKLNGCSFYVINDNVVPEARFTLVNGDRSGAEKLAIARGVHPEHEFTVFDNNSGPQIIAMAKDIIKKSKELSNVK